MSKLISISLFGLLFGCTPIYYLNNKKKILENDSQIKTLTALVDKGDYKSFLSLLQVNNENIYHSKDTLGFNYFQQIDHRCLNDQVCFSTATILHNDSLMSLAVSPSFARIRPIISNHYKKTFKRCGWTHESKSYFKSKYCNYSASTVALADASLNYRPKSHSYLDSLMSPFYRSHGYASLSNLTNEELYYLMHSIDPSIRTGVLRYMKCNKLKTNQSINNWTKTVIQNSPLMLARMSECVFAFRPIEYFLECDTLK